MRPAPGPPGIVMTKHKHTTPKPEVRPTWRELLAADEPLLLPAAHDALTARLIERSGFRAYQVGGFALAGARYAFPDIDLIHYYEEAEAIRQIVSASVLPVLVDGGNGFGDVKNVARTVLGYEELGAAAVFIEDQQAPISCGQMGKKRAVPEQEMAGKILAAVATRRNPDTFVMARTNARGSEGLPGATRRAEVYRDAGADGVFVEGLRSARELQRVGKVLSGIPLATTLMEGGGKLPWLPPSQIHDYGFQMILYPTTVLFQVTRAAERALTTLRAGRPMPEDQGVTLEAFEDVVGLDAWKKIEMQFKGE